MVKRHLPHPPKIEERRPFPSFAAQLNRFPQLYRSLNWLFSEISWIPSELTRSILARYVMTCWLLSSSQIVHSILHSDSHVTKSKALFQKRMAAEEFCLKWNDHHSVFFSVAEELLEQVKTISNFKMRSGIVNRSFTDICAGDLGGCDFGHWQVLFPRPPPCPLYLLHLLSQVPHSKWNIRKLEKSKLMLNLI